MFKMLTSVRSSDSSIYKHVTRSTQSTIFFILSRLIIYFNNVVLLLLNCFINVKCEFREFIIKIV